MQDRNDAAAAAVAAPFAYRYRFVNVEFDEAAGALRVGGEDVAVEPLPLALLLELLRHPNEVVTHAELLDTIWQGKVTVPHVVTSAVNKLRKALGEQGAARLVNVPRVGYRFSGPVERVAAGRQQRVASDLQAGAEVPGRSGYRLVRRLGNHPHSSVWLAREDRLDVSQVFKFAADGDRLAALKREYTVCRLLHRELGQRPDFVRMLAANFSVVPFYLEYEFGGSALSSWAVEDDALAALAVPERLALFLQIARAVSAVHGVGGDSQRPETRQRAHLR